MTLPRSAADVLSGHVVFEVESIDRMDLNVWQPRLQHGAGAAAFFTSHRGYRYHADGSSYAWLVKTSALASFFYFYGVDADFGPFFLKFCTCFPYTAKLCINGHEWARRQAARAGISFEPPDNGFAAGDAAARQAICDRLGPAGIDALLRKWLRKLPHPFTAADIAAGYRYELSILQAEFSLTQVLGRPAAGRIFFEQV